MTGILILAHGSRRRETEQTLDKVVDMVREQLPELLIHSGYMEFSPRNIHSCLSELAAEGATDIVVIPYFLFEGMHIREDIPGEIDCFVREHPEIRVRMGKTLGEDRRLAEILGDRIREAL